MINGFDNNVANDVVVTFPGVIVKKNYWDKKTELDSLFEAEKTGSKEPIYNAIKVIKENNKGVLPPQKYQFYADGVASQIIQLYDRIGDLDGGIAFIDSLLSSKEMHSQSRKNYLEIRQAFSDDKASGAKGNATEALIKSNYFSYWTDIQNLNPKCDHIALLAGKSKILF